MDEDVVLLDGEDVSRISPQVVQLVAASVFADEQFWQPHVVFFFLLPPLPFFFPMFGACRELSMSI